MKIKPHILIYQQLWNENFHEIYISRLYTSCEPLVTWVWDANSLPSPISNTKFGLMKGWVVVVDSIVLFRGSKYKINKQLGQTNNQRTKPQIGSNKWHFQSTNPHLNSKQWMLCNDKFWYVKLTLNKFVQKSWHSKTRKKRWQVHLQSHSSKLKNFKIIWHVIKRRQW